MPARTRIALARKTAEPRMTSGRINDRLLGHNVVRAAVPAWGRNGAEPRWTGGGMP